MANLQLKNVPEELHAELRRRAKIADKTLRDYVLDLIRRDQERATMREWLESLDELEPVKLDRRAYELIDEDRAERDRRFLERFHAPDSA